jgi:ABC-2 type transport system permease protein
VSGLTGTGTLIRLVLRRDRLLMPLWILCMALVPVAIAATFVTLYPSAAEREQLTLVARGNAAFAALYGPLYGSDIGQLLAWRIGIAPLIIGLISLLTVIRHTRTEEDAGRRELVGATVVGRYAGLAATLITTAAANLVLAAIVVIGVLGRGLPVAGTIALGVVFVLAGWVFAAVGAVAAQITEGAGGARGIGIGVLGAVFLLRAAGDVSEQSGAGLGWLTWSSPLGWGERIRPYAGERWWVLALFAGLLIGLVAMAGMLSVRRDLGSGLLPQRLGPADGPPGLRTPLALAWRLHRGGLLGWALAFAAFGLVFGSVADSIGSLLDSSPGTQEVFLRLGGRAALVDAYLATVLGIQALIAAGYGVQAALRLRSEETGGRAEPVLSTAVGRPRWVAGHLVFTLLGPALVMLVGGLAIGLTHGLAAGDVGRQLPRVLAGAAVQLPAVWVLGGLAVALFGLLPRLVGLSWGVLGGCVFLAVLGAVLQLSQWLLDLSPFTHVPRIPGGTLSVPPLVLLGLVAAGLFAGGLAGFRQRGVPVS